MATTIEFEGKNVDKALEEASQELNIPVNKIKHEVLTYGSTGIFGLVGVKKAKIKVLVKEEKNSNKPPLVEKKDIEEPSIEEIKPEKADFYDSDIKEKLAFGTKALQKILDGISEGSSIKAQIKNEKLFFEVSSGDSGVLIGKRGQTLESIQYLLEKMINKRSINRIRVFVDVEGYLEKRKSNIRQMATRMAEKAKRIKKPVTIGQMNSHDRRIVHIHLKEDTGVRTQSIGDGYYRKLVIFPKKTRWK
ncbi:MAG: RNA-binding protein [Desulfobacterales bacterium]|nr:MAG: RNA-binding protein [Desulfobacterales bacterium]